MLSFLPGPLKGIIGVLFAFFNTLFWVTPIIPIGMVKLITPAVRRAPLNRALNWLCTSWANCNVGMMRVLLDIKWEVEAPFDLSMNKWYLVISNHQSWADILALQYTLNGVVPYFRFFLKKELRWVPLLNIAWWALDYPYMTRYSKSFLEKNPHLKGKDIETTKKSCAKFKDTPVAIMNFVEGTRFREDKHAAQNSPFKHLLKPNAGGIAFVLGAMGDQLSEILDVTIAYPKGRREIWDFLCGRVPEVKVNVTRIPLSGEIMGDYFNDEDFRQKFQSWLNRIWEEKDRRMAGMLGT